MELILLVLLLIGVWGPLIHNYVRHRTSSVVVPVAALPKMGPRKCEHCDIFLPANAIRTHDGKWRCLAHKGTR